MVLGQSDGEACIVHSVCRGQGGLVQGERQAHGPSTHFVALAHSESESTAAARSRKVRCTIREAEALEMPPKCARFPRGLSVPAPLSHEVHSHSILLSTTGKFAGSIAFSLPPTTTIVEYLASASSFGPPARLRLPYALPHKQNHGETGSVVDQEQGQAPGSVRQGQGREEEGQEDGTHQAAKGGARAGRGGPTQAGTSWEKGKG